jgi:hypothetical protein
VFGVLALAAIGLAIFCLCCWAGGDKVGHEEEEAKPEKSQKEEKSQEDGFEGEGQVQPVSDGEKEPEEDPFQHPEFLVDDLDDDEPKKKEKPKHETSPSAAQEPVKPPPVEEPPPVEFAGEEEKGTEQKDGKEGGRRKRRAKPAPPPEGAPVEAVAPEGQPAVQEVAVTAPVGGRGDVEVPINLDLWVARHYTASFEPDLGQELTISSNKGTIAAGAKVFPFKVIFEPTTPGTFETVLTVALSDICLQTKITATATGKKHRHHK